MQQNEYYVVVGMGKTGFSCLEYLTAKNKRVIMMDTRTAPPYFEKIKQRFATVEYYVGELPATILMKAKEIILSPGLAITDLPISHPHVIGDVELFARENTQPVIAITGTNAKSTVTALVGYMAEKCGVKVKVGANLGIPALELLNDEMTELFVLELSSFQLETTYSLAPVAATILNISSDHCDRYAAMSDYINAKLRIYANAKTAIYNHDDPNTYSSCTNSNSFTLGLPTTPQQFGLRQLGAATYLAQGEDALLNVNALKMQGQHNWQNALAALALGTAAGLAMPTMLQCLQEFTGLPHRCQFITNKNNIAWYNDSKGTNIGASIAALTGLAAIGKGKIVLIAGGQGKGQDFTEMKQAVADYTKAVILIGEDAPILTAAWQDCSEIINVPDLAAAVKLANNIASSGDSVLLSPACASWDMFNNYEHRGEVFMNLVNEVVS